MSVVAEKPYGTVKKIKVSRKRWSGQYDLMTAAIHKLRINIKSLAYEAKAIRQEERVCGIAFEAELRDHRITTLRMESRAALLTRAILLGRSITDVEGEQFNVLKCGSKAKAQLCAKICVKIERLGVVSKLNFSILEGRPVKESLAQAVIGWLSGMPRIFVVDGVIVATN